LYIALHRFGGMPAPLAGIGTAAFCAYLALYPALAGWLATRWTKRGSSARLVAAAAAWTPTERARSRPTPGFPWLAVGYSQLPAAVDATGSPLVGFASLGGVWLVTLAVATCAAALTVVIEAFVVSARKRVLGAIVASVVIGSTGALLSRIEWTEPIGNPINVSLFQGNITQDLNFDPGFIDETYRISDQLVNASRGRLMVRPESAYPVFAEEIPESVLQHLVDTAKARGGDVLVGMFTMEPPLPDRDEPRYYNTVVHLGQE